MSPAAIHLSEIQQISSNKVQRFAFISILLLSGFNQNAWAWGERGHDLVSRLACRIVLSKYKDIPEFSHPFIQKEHMLGHLGNVPDIYWKNIPKDQALYGSPSHYIDLEYIDKTPELGHLSADIQKTYATIKKNCASTDPKDHCSNDFIDVMNKVGTVPWRIGQLATLYRDKLKELTEAKVRPKNQEGNSARNNTEQNFVDSALLYAGLLSHFVADNAQPMHTTANYDGWDTNQGGLHAYFETDVINSMNLKLDQDTLDYALKNKPAEKLISKAIAEKRIKKDDWQPVEWALILSIDSYSHLDEVLKIDKARAIKNAGKSHSNRQAASRKPANDLTKDYYPLVVERLATGADMLAFYWYQGWVQAGKPNLKNYFSYTYHFTPDFIKPDYLGK